MTGEVRLIDANEVLARNEEAYNKSNPSENPVSVVMFHAVKAAVEASPTVDAVEVVRGQMRIEIDRDAFDEDVMEEARKRGWYRKRYFCPCGQLIKTESWEKEHCFGSGTVLRNNVMPKHCPNCGAKVDDGNG